MKKRDLLACCYALSLSLCLSGCVPSDAVASEEPTPRPRVHSSETAESREGSRIPESRKPRKRAGRAPILISSNDIHIKMRELSFVVPSQEEDLEIGSRPFEGERSVRQRLLQPLSRGVSPKVEKLVHETLTFDPKELEPLTRSRLRRLIQELLELEAFEALDAIGDTLRRKRIVGQDGGLLLATFYDSLRPRDREGGHLEKTVLKAERWMKTSPNSLTSRWFCGESYYKWAWEARGKGWASSVTREGWRLFRERLEKAKKVLPTVEEQVQDPFLYTQQIDIARGLGSPREEAKAYLQRAKALGPRYAYRAYAAYSYYLAPEWHGKPGERSEFLEEVAAETKAEWGHSMYALLAYMTDPREVDKKRELQGYRELVDANPSSVLLFQRCANLTFELEGLEDAEVLYRRVLDGELRIPLTEGDKIRLKERMKSTFPSLQEPLNERALSEVKTSVLSVRLGMSREELQKLLGPSLGENVIGRDRKQINYRREGSNYSFIVDESIQKIVLLGGYTCSVESKTLSCDMTYAELEKQIGRPSKIIEPTPRGFNQTYRVVYEDLDLTILWNGRKEKFTLFIVDTKARELSGSSRSLTVEEWRATWPSNR